MAYFAELNSSSLVLQVVVISNEDVAAHGGDESTTAEDFVESLVPFRSGGDSWKQTSYSNSFRKQYAGIGFIYDAAKDMFIISQPYPSWTLNSAGDWDAPVTYPNDAEEGGLFVFIRWDEDNLRWLGSTFTSPNTGETKYRWDASALNWVAL